MAERASEANALKSRFEAVYRQNAWGDDESASGAGSRLDSACVSDTEGALEFAIRELGVRSIVDAPCGDFNWMRLFVDRHPEVDYRGFDIVEDIVARNAARFPDRRFAHADLTRTRPPEADLILCKDLVNHLNDEDVCRLLQNFRASGSRYLLLSNNSGFDNVELPLDVGGMSRHLDVTRPPFGFPAPIWATHYLGLWRVDQIPHEFVLPPTCQASSTAADRPAADYVSGASLMDDMPPLQVLSRRGHHGIVLFGPYLRAKAGRYRASFRIHVPADGAAAKPCARVEVTSAGGAVVICQRAVSPAELRADPRVVLQFELAAEQVLELRVSSLGTHDLVVDHERFLLREERRFGAAA